MVLLFLRRTFGNVMMMTMILVVNEAGVLVALVLSAVSWWFGWCVVRCVGSTALSAGLPGSPTTLCGVCAESPGKDGSPAALRVWVPPWRFQLHRHALASAVKPHQSRSLGLSDGFHPSLFLLSQFSLWRIKGAVADAANRHRVQKMLLRGHQQSDHPGEWYLASPDGYLRETEGGGAVVFPLASY